MNEISFYSGRPVRAFPKNCFVLEGRRIAGLPKVYEQRTLTAFKILILTEAKPPCRVLWLPQVRGSSYPWFLFKASGIFFLSPSFISLLPRGVVMEPWCWQRTKRIIPRVGRRAGNTTPQASRQPLSVTYSQNGARAFLSDHHRRDASWTGPTEQTN